MSLRKTLEVAKYGGRAALTQLAIRRADELYPDICKQLEEAAWRGDSHGYVRITPLEDVSPLLQRLIALAIWERLKCEGLRGERERHLTPTGWSTAFRVSW